MEQIYTIPVNEAFEAALSEEHAGCPFCRLMKKLEEDELDIILGASMMEPDIRIKTNEMGFCAQHYGKMLEKGNRLSLALILESHLAEVEKKLKSGGFADALRGRTASKLIGEVAESCYICKRTEYNFSRMMSTAVMLWENDPEFRKKCKAQEFYCLPHFSMLLSSAKAQMNKKTYPAFEKAASEVEKQYMEKIHGGIGNFVKKFDYRYAGEPLEEAKDAPEAAIRFLSGFSKE